ncbi:hypothetical protein ACFQY7_18285 [Actinomadura luteofluorescens]|uniref:Transposase n=1 Tax=Actinomadura luteofluorescens TaxID=46163 RepID=A0A7Y9JLN0_9ACTN|nr:hypothetical protein [Actinomadura luteofluorescens]
MIGVDIHRDTLAAAAVTSLGAVLAHLEASTDARGYARLLEFAELHFPAGAAGRSNARDAGAGLTAVLDAAGERVVEVFSALQLHDDCAERCGLCCGRIG